MAVITKTLKRTGGDYSLMTTWESTEQTDLVSAGDSHVLECYEGDGTASGNWQADGSLNESVNISGWTTGATNFVTVKAAAGEGHNGVPDTGFRIYVNDSAVLSCAVGYTVISDFQVEATGSYVACNPTGTGSLVDSMIIKCTATANRYAIVYTSSSILRNTLLVFSYRGMDLRTPTGTNVENCTFVGTGSASYGLLTDSNNTVINTVSVGSSTCFLGLSSTDSNCASGDTTASASTDSVTGVVTTDGVDFVSPSTGDYTPTSTGKLAGTGTDLSADFLDDITGTAR